MYYFYLTLLYNINNLNTFKHISKTLITIKTLSTITDKKYCTTKKFLFRQTKNLLQHKIVKRVFLLLLVQVLFLKQRTDKPITSKCKANKSKFI